MNIAKATHEDFATHVKKTFKVTAEAIAFEAELIEVAPTGGTLGPTGRTPFSLVWRGPDTAEPLQQVYRVEHEDVGVLDLFLVPLGPDDQGMKYEAVVT